jgi:hypothetical protein
LARGLEPGSQNGTFAPPHLTTFSLELIDLRRIGESLHRFYSFFQLSQLEAFPVYGPPDARVRGLREVAEVGAALILLNPVFDEVEQMERLMAEVVPKLS